MNVTQASFDKKFIISTPNVYTITENIISNETILIESDDVILDGNNFIISQKNVNNCIGIRIANNCKNIQIKNLTLQKFSAGGIYCSKNSNLKFDNIKITNCGYSNIIEKFPFNFSCGFMFNDCKYIELNNCLFSEFGFLNKTYGLNSSAIFAYHTDNFRVKGCTIDGCVGAEISFGVVLICMSGVLIDDLFITDIYSSKTAKGIYNYDVDASVKNFLETTIISNLPPSQFEYYLKNHGNYHIKNNTIDSKPIQVSHVKNVIPKHREKEEILFQEHKWREFRTLYRLVCHNSNKISQTSAIYGKWVELYCERVLKVKVRVEAAFANLYPTGETPLPLHRDQYKKWIFGLSFGETRTFEFIPDNDQLNVIKYTLDSGDIFIFSHDVNERFQHRMSSEPERKGRRINITYFIEVLEKENEDRLLLPIGKNIPTDIPTFEEAETIFLHSE